MEWHYRKGTQQYDEHYVSGRWDVWHEGSDDGDRWVIHCEGLTDRDDDSAILAYRETWEGAIELASRLQAVLDGSPAPTPVVTRAKLDELIDELFAVPLNAVEDELWAVKGAERLRDALLAEIEQQKYEAAMDDFERHTTPGGTWIMEDDSDD